MQYTHGLADVMGNQCPGSIWFHHAKQSPSVQHSTPSVPAHGKEELAKDSLPLLSMPSNEVEDRICNSFEQDNSSQAHLQSQAVGESWPINYNQWVGN